MKSGQGRLFPLDTSFRLVATFDMDENEQDRRQQIAYLARYARQSVFAWDDVLVTEMLGWHKAVSDIVRDEQALSEE